MSRATYAPDGAARSTPVQAQRPAPAATFHLPHRPVPQQHRHPTSVPRGLIVSMVLLALMMAVWLLVRQHADQPSSSAQGAAVQPTSQNLNPAPAAPLSFAELGAEVDQLVFFESASGMVGKSERSYSSDFVRGLVRCMNWEIDIRHPQHPSRQEFTIRSQLYSPDGGSLAQQELNTFVEPAWTSSYHANQWCREAADWVPGVYRLNLYVGGQEIASNSFTIHEPTQVADPPTEDSSTAPEVDTPEPEPAPPPVEPARGLWRHFGQNQTERPPAQPPENTPDIVAPARLLYRVQPIYPPLARQARIQGMVRLTATIGRDGTLHAVRALSGSPLLRGAAIAAVDQWRYIPSQLHGEATESETQIDINFELGQ